MSSDKSSARMWLALALAAIALVAIWTDAWPWLRGPAPYPREWQWVFQPRETLDRIWWAVAATAAIVALLVASSSPALSRASAASRLALLGGAVLLGTCFQVAVLHLEPNGAAATWMERTYSPRFTSFFSMAAETNHLDEGAILGQYDALLDHAGDAAFHAATHPPGGVLFYRALIRFFRRAPAVTNGVSSVLGAFGVDAAGLIPPDAPSNAKTLPYAIAAIVGGLLLAIGGALTSVPLAYAAEALGASPASAMQLAILWPLCPALVNFSPYLDQTLTLPVTAALALLLIAGSKDPAHIWTDAYVGILTAAAAGACMAAACFISYGALGMLALVGLVVLASGATRLRPTIASLVIAGATMALLAIGLRIAGFDYVRSALKALALHRERFTLVRTYRLWLGFNLIDFAVFAGIPGVAYACMTVVGGAINGRWRRSAAVRAGMAVFAGLALLDVTGTVRGEVGRVWLPLMPMIFLAMGADRPSEEMTNREAVMMAIALAGLAIALRVKWGP